jgi:hypothetical protein
MRNIFIIGIVLFLLSAYPLYLMGVEVSLGNYAYGRYEVFLHTGENFDYRSADFYGHRITLTDNLEVDPAKLPKDENVYLKAPVKITVDGQDYSLSSPTEIRVFNGSKSVSGSVALVNLKDRRSGEERLAIIQRVDGERYPDDMRYRILFVQPNGTVTEEWFTYAERDEPVYRTMLAKYVHSEPLGFRSQVISVWPTIVYPILYPWLTGFVGFILSVVGGIVLLKRRGRSRGALP